MQGTLLRHQCGIGRVLGLSTFLLFVWIELFQVCLEAPQLQYDCVLSRKVIARQLCSRHYWRWNYTTHRLPPCNSSMRKLLILCLGLGSQFFQLHAANNALQRSVSLTTKPVVTNELQENCEKSKFPEKSATRVQDGESLASGQFYVIWVATQI